MNLLSREDLQALVDHETGPYVTIYIPTHRKGKETIREDPIRLKNQLDIAAEQLMAAGLRRPEAKKLLEPAQDLLPEVPFWEHQSDGLALFIAPGLFQPFSAPLTFADQTVVNHHSFHLKPLIPLLAGNGRFYILALSQNEIRLFQATRDAVQEVDLRDTPRSLTEALALEDPERELQFHTSTAPGAAGVGSARSGAASKMPGHGQNRGQSRDAVFHGHSQDLDQKEFILRFFQRVNDGVSGILVNEEAPLLLAGVDYLLPLYRQANSYRNLLEGGLSGNPETKKADKLHQEAWALVAPHFAETQQAGFEKYQALRQNGLATADVEKIIPAAHYGAVDTLFVALERQQWGQFDPDNNRLQLDEESTPDNQDLLDLAAMRTFLNSGIVYALPDSAMPDGAPVAAIFRYEPTTVPAAEPAAEGDGR